MTLNTQAPPAELDMDAVQAFAMHVAGMLIGGGTTAMMVVGDRLGLYSALAAGGPTTAPQLAEATGTSERLVREWLAQQAAVGILDYDPATERFSLSAERAAVLATDDSPASLIGAAPMISGMHRRVDRLVESFRSGEGIPWGEQDPTIFESTERFFGTAYKTFLVPEWIPAVKGAVDRLHSGASVADVGCGHGLPLLLLAQSFPDSTYVGYDVHQASVDHARRRANEQGVSEQVRFEVADAVSYPQAGYDLITFFDSFHDLGDPVGAAEYARAALAGGGTLMLVEPLAADDLATTIATMPTAGLSYAASTFLCAPNSLSQPVGLALGAQAGQRQLSAALNEAGFATVRRVAETPFHMVLQATP